MLVHSDSLRLAARESVFAQSACKHCGQKGTHPFCEMVLKIKKMSDKELLETWSSLGKFGPDGDFYDKKNSITMESWYQALYAEIISRKI